MRKIAWICCLLILTLSSGHKTFAQDAPNTNESAKAPEAPVHFYHLDFVVQEMGSDGKPTNSRSYAATVSTGPHDRGTSIRTNSRVPFPTGPTTGANGEIFANTQFQYVDVGVNIDARSAREVGRLLSIDLVADVSSMGTSPVDTGIHAAVTRQNKWQATVLIPIGKPTVVFSSDTLDSKSSMQVVATAILLQ
jgi:hypothetical protein